MLKLSPPLTSSIFCTSSYGKLYAIIIAIALLCSSHSLAESGTLSDYAILDVDEVVNQSVAYKEFKERWGRVSDKFQKEIEFYESQLSELERKVTVSLSRKADNMTSSAKAEIINDKKKIGAYEVKVQELLRARKEALEGALDKSTEILRANIDKIVFNYAKQNKITIIFARVQVIYFSEAVDITNDILKRLNNKLRKLEVDI